jgi:hypothetical protein
MIKLDDIVTNKGERNYTQSFIEYGEDITRSDILPGHYYSIDISVPNFNSNWIPESEEAWQDSPDSYITSKEYYDLSPVGPVFYHDNWKNVALVLNLKVIPPRFRPKIIQTHLSLIEDSLNRINWGNSEVPTIDLYERRKMNLSLYRVTPKMIQDLTGLKLNWAISGYKLDKVSRAKIMDWDNIGELPYSNMDVRGLEISSGLLDHSILFDRFENKQLI